MVSPVTHPAPQHTPGSDGWKMLELELTGRCQLACVHCYADSGPREGHGTMTVDEWKRVIDEAADAGFRAVQFIGGEPTAHPAFAELAQYALDRGLHVEVFSNLYRVDLWWDLFAHERCTLATSYYSDRADQHDEATGRRGSHARTRAAIAEAVRRRIDIRVGIIEVLEGQRVEEAESELRRLGVSRIKTDRMRGVGRGATVPGTPSVDELCGHCGRGKAAVGPTGDVWPCVLGRSMRAGNVRDEPLADILHGPKMRDLVATIPPPRRIDGACNPGSDGNDCSPAETIACPPKYS